MTIATFIALLPALFGLAASAAEPEATEVRTLVIQNQVIMRIPVRPRPLSPIEWVERQGPKCIPSQAIRGATISGSGQVDFLLFNRRRVRAQLGEDCPALDFYNGFYLNPEDERLCAGRDSIRSRIGGSCEIERFHLLMPRRKPIP